MILPSQTTIQTDMARTTKDEIYLPCFGTVFNQAGVRTVIKYAERKNQALTIMKTIMKQGHL